MDMDVNTQDDKFIKRLQQLHFDIIDEKEGPSKKASSIRSMYCHLLESQMYNSKSHPVMVSEAEKYLKLYSEVVDQMDGTGLNNYAEGALALCCHHKNESQKWKSHLSVESMVKMCLPDEEDEDDESQEDSMITFRSSMPDILDRIDSNNTAPDFKSSSSELLKQKQHCSLPKDGNSLQNQTNLTSNKLLTMSSKYSNCLPDDATSPNYMINRNNKTSEVADVNVNPQNTVENHRFNGNLSNNVVQMPGMSNTEMQVPNLQRQNPFMPKAGKQMPTFANTQGQSPDMFNTGMQRPTMPNSLGQNPTMPNSGVQMPSLLNRVHQSLWTSSASFQQHKNNSVNSNPAPSTVVAPQKVGGPYANFGQKRKCPEQTWKRGSSKYQKNSRDEEDEENYEESHENTQQQQGPFRTAKQQLIISQQKKNTNTADRSQVSSTSYGSVKRSLGTRRGPASKFVPPVMNRDEEENEPPRQASSGYNQHQNKPSSEDEFVDERLRGIDPKMIELINNEIMDTGTQITWDDIAGLDFAKKTIKEIVVWPMLRPDIFTGLRGPPKGLLLFGPPGTGKTLIGKCIASQSKSTFFCISASSLTSKWVGEGEKMVKALFAVARVEQPSVVFIDEIDSLLSQRSNDEHESSRRIKTEFLVQLDGAATGSEDRILVIGATNRPQEIDEAARRRFVKRLLIPLPEAVARQQIIINLMSQQNSDLSEQDVQSICDQTDGYSGADMTNLCREAALGPIRSIPFEQMETITADQVRPINFGDFKEAVLQVRASVSSKDLQLYSEWNQTYGSFGH